MRFSQLIPNSTRSLKKIFASLESKNYRLYFAGQGISLIGTWMQNIAMSWLVYRITGSVFLLGLVSFTSQVPTFILSPFAGVITDRFNRHKIMVATQVLFLVQAGILALLVLTNNVQVWHVIVLSLFFGLISAFDAPARQSLVIDLIEKPENLSNAIALNSAMFNGARLIGPGIAGFTIALVGEGICFTINAVSYIAVIWALMAMSMPTRVNPQKPNTNLKKSFSEGFKYTFGFAPIRILLILLGVISLFGLPYVVLMPPYAKEILKGGSGMLGLLMSATGAGALSGSLYLAARKTVIGLGRIITISTITFGASIIIASYSTNAVVSILSLYLTGLAMISAIASVNTLIQTIADEDKRGRVMSFYAMALMGMNPIGNLLAGTIATAIGVAYTLAIGGLITIGVGFWFQKQRPVLRKYIRPVFISKGIIQDTHAEVQPSN
jgi:MFS family permease